MQNFHQSTRDYDILHGDRSSDDEQLLTRTLLRKTKYANMAGHWTLKFTFFFYGDNSWTVAFRQAKFGILKIVDIHTSFILIIFFDGAFEYDDGGIFKLLKWMQKLHQSTWDHEMLYADRSSEEEQLLKKPKNRNMAGFWMLKFTFHFRKTIHEPLHLDKWSFVLRKTCLQLLFDHYFCLF
jgi:hypothetical protein